MALERFRVVANNDDTFELECDTCPWSTRHLFEPLLDLIKAANRHWDVVHEDNAVARAIAAHLAAKGQPDA